MKHIFAILLCTLLLASCSSLFIPDYTTVSVEDYTQERVVGDVSPIAPFWTFLSKADAYTTVPGFKQRFIPQGLSVTDDYVYVCGYFDNSNPSAIMVIDKSSGRFVKVIELQKKDGSDYTGHAGGIAVTETDVYIANASKLFRLSLSAIDAVPLNSVKTLCFEDETKVPVRASFCNYSNGTLWVGDYENGDDYATDDYRHVTSPNTKKEFKAWTVGYKISATNKIEDYETDNSGCAVPDLILAIPGKVQGFVVTDAGIVLSTSYGSLLSSSLMLFSNILTNSADNNISYNGVSVPAYYLDSNRKQLAISLPPMSEGIDFSNNELFILFESGSLKFKEDIIPRLYPTDQIWKLTF